MPYRHLFVYDGLAAAVELPLLVYGVRYVGGRWQEILATLQRLQGYLLPAVALAVLAPLGLRVAAVDGPLAPVRCAKGMRVVPDVSLAEAPALDVLVVPGGLGTRRAAKDPALLAWLAARAASCQWVTSVCTGALLLVASGVARGRRVTTHHSFVETLRARGDATVLEGVRFVRDGNVVTAAGVASAAALALALVYIGTPISTAAGSDHQGASLPMIEAMKSCGT